MISTWVDTGPAWIAAVGGILGALASIYAIRIAARAEREHVSWIKVITRTSAKGSAIGFEMVNGAKRTIAVVEAVNDVTGDSNDALDTFTELPIEVAPGSSFPLAVSRSLANSYPTVVEISWRERDVAKKQAKKETRTVRHYL